MDGSALAAPSIFLFWLCFETMINDIFIGLIYVSFMYFFGALTIKGGLPPIYKETKSIIEFISPSRGEVMGFMYWSFVGVGTLMFAILLNLFTGFDEFFLIVPAWFFYAGWSIRSKIKRTTRGPLPWVTVYTASPLLFPLFDRRPMLLFDIWTLAVTGVFGLPMISIAFMTG